MSGFEGEFYDIVYTTPSGKTKTVQLPRVSTIISKAMGASPFLVNWAYKLGQEGGESPSEFVERRADEGMAAHDYVENWIKGYTTDRVDGFMQAWDRFALEQQLKPSDFLFSEQVVYSLEHGYAGTLDIIRNGPFGPRVDDVKTKKKTIYKAYTKEIVQCRAYAVAAHEMGLIDEHADTGIIILKPNGRYTYDERTCEPDLWYAVLEVYKQLEKHNL